MLTKKTLPFSSVAVIWMSKWNRRVTLATQLSLVPNFYSILYFKYGWPGRYIDVIHYKTLITHSTNTFELSNPHYLNLCVILYINTFEMIIYSMNHAVVKIEFSPSFFFLSFFIREASLIFPQCTLYHLGLHINPLHFVARRSTMSQFLTSVTSTTADSIYGTHPQP